MLRGQWQTLPPDGVSRAGGEDRGIVTLDDVGVLTFTGPDVVSFLQGYLTADTELMTEDPQFTAVCNIKGRTVCTGYAWRHEQTLTLVLDQSLCQPLLDFLQPYLAFSRTQATDATATTLVFGALDVEIDSNAHGGALDQHRRLILTGDLTRAEALWSEHAHLEADRWRAFAIARREVWLNATTSAVFLPQMLALDELGAVSFDKGCYLGQEVVARAQHRGKVKRTLTSLTWTGAVPSIGSELTGSDARSAGTLVATTRSPDQGLALAVLGGNHPDSLQGASNTVFTVQSPIPSTTAEC